MICQKTHLQEDESHAQVRQRIKSELAHVHNNGDYVVLEREQSSQDEEQESPLKALTMPCPGFCKPNVRCSNNTRDGYAYSNLSTHI